MVLEEFSLDRFYLDSSSSSLHWIIPIRSQSFISFDWNHGVSYMNNGDRVICFENVFYQSCFWLESITIFWYFYPPIRANTNPISKSFRRGSFASTHGRPASGQEERNQRVLFIWFRYCTTWFPQLNSAFYPIYIILFRSTSHSFPSSTVSIILYIEQINRFCKYFVHFVVNYRPSSKSFWKSTTWWTSVSSIVTHFKFTQSVEEIQCNLKWWQTSPAPQTNSLLCIISLSIQ